MPSNVIAIDGPAASGKSTLAQSLAQRLHIPYVSTGAMYRAVGWKVAKANLDPDDPAFDEKVIALLPDTKIEYCPENGSGFKVDGVFPGAELRTDQVSMLASRVAVIPAVRHFLVAMQREMAQRSMIVMEGRDIGTAVFPDAKYKFFLTASARVRAMRRLEQDGKTLDDATINSVAKDIEARDLQDSTREMSPLCQAEDAILIDNSTFSEPQETLDAILKYITI